MNSFTYVFVVALILNVLTQWLLANRHIRHVRQHRQQVPAAFADNIPLCDHQNAADYTTTKVRANVADLLLSTVILLLWTLGGGLQLLDSAWRSLGWSPLFTGTVFLLSTMLITSVLDIPMSVYRVFFVEQKFGFNKMTVGIFVTDLFKNTAIFAVVGTPLLMLVLWVLNASGDLWWLYVWVIWLGFSLLMMWAYPNFIAPLFNEFRPLQDEVLKQRIERLLDRNGFSSNGVFVMDGSTRSTHGNAYFTGLGWNKRIVFFDTLMDELNHDEIEAVLAHELGHFKCHHITKRIAIMAVLALLSMALLGWLINVPWFYEGLGVAAGFHSNYMAVLLFIMIAPAVTFVLQPVFAFMSRKHEFEADDFAVAQAQAQHLIKALATLYKENANTLTPDPLYSAFYDSHPPAAIRIAHLSATV